MKLDSLISLVSSEPVFTSGMLLTPGESERDVRRQLSRWTKAGKVLQLRRKLYALAEPHRKTTPHPFLVANRLRAASYVSLQSALAFHGMIPEHVATVTSVTTGRPEEARTPLGDFVFRHLKKSFFREFRDVEVSEKQSAFVATPEKALLDLIYLTPRADSRAWLEELRLQNIESLDVNRLFEIAESSGSPKLARAARLIAEIAGDEEFEEL